MIRVPDTRGAGAAPGEARTALRRVRLPYAAPARRSPRPAGGWTLIELLIVISLITILAGIALANYRTAVTRSQEAVLREDLFRMRDAIDQYYADKGQYPPTLDSLVSEGYLRRVPVDPFTDSADTWVTILAEQDASNPLADPGIFDVKSGAAGVSLDGSNYADW